MMFYHIQDQVMENPDVSEQDIEGFIRDWFKQPDWMPPKD